MYNSLHTFYWGWYKFNIRRARRGGEPWKVLNGLALPSSYTVATLRLHSFTHSILTSGHHYRSLKFIPHPWTTFQFLANSLSLLPNLRLCFSFCLGCCSPTLAFFPWLISFHLHVLAEILLPHQGCLWIISTAPPPFVYLSSLSPWPPCFHFTSRN